jgi:hypothetical protein
MTRTEVSRMLRQIVLICVPLALLATPPIVAQAQTANLHGHHHEPSYSVAFAAVPTWA